MGKTAAEIVEKAEAGAGLAPGFFEKLLNSFIDYIPTLILALIIFLIGFFLNKLVLKIIGRGMKKAPFDKTIHSFISSIAKILLYSIVIVIVLTVLGIPMTSIITVIGSAGIAIGLAMQSSLSNVAGGMIVLMGKQFKLGDYVKINGDEGTVRDITILFTKLATLDNKVIYIPNGSVSTATIVNYTQEATRRVDLTFGISYKNDYKKAIEVIKEVCEKAPLILNSPEPFVHISELSSSSINIEVRVWVQSEEYWNVHFGLIEQIKDAFDENGISIPYNQLDIHMTSENK